MVLPKETYTLLILKQSKQNKAILMMFCYASANKNSCKLTGSYWMRNLEIIPMIEKLKGKKQRVKPLDILSRYKFFLPFNSSESAGGHKTCRDILNANLPALPWTGYTVSNTVHTTCGISSIPPVSLPTLLDSNWINSSWPSDAIWWRQHIV